MRDDLRRALRYLARRPAITLFIVGTLAIGIGAATVVFSMIHRLVLAPLPFADASRLVRIWEVTPDRDHYSMSIPTYLDLRRDAGLESTAPTSPAAASTAADKATFSDVGALSEILDGLVLTGEGAPARLQSAAVTASLFPLLGAETTLGRTFTAEADRPGARVAEVVLSHRLWTARFGAGPDVIGHTIRLNGAAYTVVGVLRAGFELPDTADVWIPLSSDPAYVTQGDRDDKWLTVIARLAPGQSAEGANHWVAAVGERLSEQYPQANGGGSLVTSPLDEAMVERPVRALLWTLVGAVACLLLLTCANVAGLLLTEAVRRDGEFRLRATLGATAPRLARQLLVESSVLAALGAGAGLALAFWAVDVLRTHARGVVPRIEHVGVDGHALAAALLVTVACCVLIGTAPGLRATRVDLRAGLDGSGHPTRSGRSPIRRGLIVLEVGLALVLLAGAGLMATSFARLSTVDLGFTPEGRMAVPVDLSGGQYTDAQRLELLAALEARIAALPPVQAVGATTTNPLRQFGFRNTVTPVERVAEAPPSGLLPAQWRSVTPGFFRALGIPLVRGEWFPPDVRADGPRVVIVSASLAGRLWPGEDPVGKQILWGGTTGTPRTVIGVAGDIRDVHLDQPPQPTMFVPHAQVPVPSMTLVVSSRHDMAALPPLVQGVFRELAPDMPVPEVQPIVGSRAHAAGRTRLVAVMLVSMAATGVVLATSGIYALLAFAVVQRRREIAIRLAVGSAPAQVARLVVGDGLRLTVPGLLLGTGAAVGLGRFMGSALYGVASTDPVIIGVVAVLLLGASLLASYLPARAAARVDPVTALRSE